MTASRSWDRAAGLPVPIDQRRLPEIAALASGLPSVPALFDFMRDAELRFATLRMRIVETALTARGETSTTFEVVVRHPGQAKVITTGEAQGARADYAIWCSDGEVVRTYAVAHHLGTQRPTRHRPRGLDDDDIPGPSRVYEPLTPLPADSLADALIHPAGLCQNVLATGRCTIVGSELVGGREAVVLECDHPRATQIGTDRPDYRIAISVDRETGVILRFVESIDGRPTRQAEVVVFGPDAALQPSDLQFVFPSGTTMLY